MKQHVMQKQQRKMDACASLVTLDKFLKGHMGKVLKTDFWGIQGAF